MRAKFKNINYLLAQERYSEYIEEVLSILRSVYSLEENKNDFVFLIDILKECLRIEQQLLKNTELRGRILAHISNLCRLDSYFSYSLSFYFIAFINFEKAERYPYYNNIGLLLFAMKNYDKSIYFYNLSLESIDNSTKPARQKYIDKTFTLLNIATAYLANGRKREAYFFFKSIDFTNFDTPFKDRTNYHLLKLFIDEFEKIGFKLKNLNFFLAYTKTLIKQKKYQSFIDINRYLWSNIDKHHPQRLKVLYEVYNLSKENNIKDTLHFTLKKLVEHYTKEEKNEDLLNKFLLELYTLDYANNTDHSPLLLTLYLDEVTKSFEELKLTNDLLEEKKSELERITFILSHDLKTPLRSLNSFAQLLERSVNKNDYANIKEYSTYISKYSQNLFNIIEGVNFLKLVNRLVDKKQIVDLNTLLHKLEVQTSEKMKKKVINVAITQKLPSINANYTLLHTVLRNILENGFTYNESEVPTINISSKKSEFEFILQLEDNGIGIDEEYHDKIFELFSRLHNIDKYEGTGFGLGISNKIMNAYNGKITINTSTKYLSGSIFSLHFPVKILEVSIE